MFRIIVLCLAMINYAISVQVPLMPKKQVSFMQSNTNEACNWQCYLDRYGDLQRAFGAHNVTAAERHWGVYGQGEGRDCTCGCNWQCYLNRYVDLQNAFGAHNVQSAETHWAQYGQREGRDCTCGSAHCLCGHDTFLPNANPPGWASCQTILDVDNLCERPDAMEYARPHCCSS